MFRPKLFLVDTRTLVMTACVLVRTIRIATRCPMQMSLDMVRMIGSWLMTMMVSVTSTMFLWKLAVRLRAI